MADHGYAGMGYTGTEAIPEMLAALDARGLRCSASTWAQR